jgi:hypothetical protein
MGLGTKNHCAGESQQPFSSQLGTELSVVQQSAYTGRLTPPLVKEKTPLLKDVHVYKKTEILVMDLDETQSQE